MICLFLCCYGSCFYCLFCLYTYFPGLLQVSLRREEKSVYLPTKFPSVCDWGLHNGGPAGGDSGCDPLTPWGHVSHSSCFLPRPTAATVAEAWMQKELSSGKDGKASKLTCAGHGGDKAAEFTDFCSGASGLSPYSSTNSRSRDLPPHLCFLSLIPRGLKNQVILQLSPSDSPGGLPPGHSG